MRLSVSEIAEIISAVAIVIGLIVVGIELNQNTQLQKSNTTQSIVRDYVDSVALLATDEELADIYIRGAADIENLSNVESLRFYSMLYNLNRAYEQLHISYKEGLIEPGVWNGFKQQMVESHKGQGIRDYWDMRKQWYSVSFQEHMDIIINTETEYEIPSYINRSEGLD